MSQSIQFSINRISAPRIGFAEFAALTQRLGVHAIEIRNDLAGVEMVDGTPGKTGLAHLFEHMAFKGTKTINSAGYEKEKILLEKVERLKLLL